MVGDKGFVRVCLQVRHCFHNRQHCLSPTYLKNNLQVILIILLIYKCSKNEGTSKYYVVSR